MKTMDNKFKYLKIKTLNDKFTILINEILNLISVANYMNNADIEKLSEKIENILKEIKEDIDIGDDSETLKEIKKDIKKRIYKIKKIKIEKSDRIKELSVAIYTLLELLKRCKYGLLYVNEYLHHDTNYLDDLILFSFLEEEEIKNILSNINVLSKLIKFRRENAQQIYIPSSLLHRRYRLYNNQKFMNELIYNKINSFLKENSNIFDIEENDNNKDKRNKERSIDFIKFLLTSDYDIGESLDVKNTKNLTLIKGSFFWRELFRFQSLIFHEIGHTLQHLLNNELKKDYEKFTEEIFVQCDTDFFNLSELQSIKDEIFVDALCLFLLGDAYILSMVFYGLLGLNFYKTLVDVEENRDSKREKKDERIIHYKFQNIYVYFTPRREKHILRFVFLMKLRDYLKNKKEIETKFNLIDKNLEKTLKSYLNDLFPIYSTSGVSYSNLEEISKEMIEYISDYINYLADEFLIYFKNKFKFKSEINLKDTDIFSKRYKDYKEIYLKTGSGIFIENKEDKEDIIDTFYVKAEDRSWFKLQINLDKSENSEPTNSDIIINKISEKDIKDKNPISIDIYNLMWKIALSQFKKIFNENKNEEFKLIGKSLKDGRVFTSFQITAYTPYKDLVNELISIFKEEGVKLNVGYLGFVKGKEFYKIDNANGNTLQNKLSSFFDAFSKKATANYLMGPHDFYLYGIGHTKRIESNIYIPLIKNKAFMDTHSILKINNELTGDENNNELIVNKVWAFSFGWEDVILKEKELNNIFQLKSFIQKEKGKIGIKRTETLISYNFKNNNNIYFESFILTKLENKKIVNFNKKIGNDNTDSKYRLLVNLRIKNEILNKENQCSKENQDKFESYQFPGRYDIIVISEKIDEPKKILEMLLETEIPCIYKSLTGEFRFYEIEDMVVDILKEEQPKKA